MPKSSLALAPRVATKLQPKLTPLTVTSPQLALLIENRMMVAAKLSQYEAKKKKYDADILALVTKKTGSKDRPVETADYLVSPVNAENVSISAELLLKLGVRASVIEKAKKKTPYSYPRITKKKTVADADDLP